jgi:hypothetical protein
VNEGLVALEAKARGREEVAACAARLSVCDIVELEIPEPEMLCEAGKIPARLDEACIIEGEPEGAIGGLDTTTIG